ncbi:MAG: ABC transporter ATP-binding protein [Anaeromyxobacter sp.]
MLRLENVSRSFAGPDGEIHALRGVNLAVARGDFLAVVGPSGSGKSTLLHAVGGLAAPTSGLVHLGGASVYDLDLEARAALRRTEVGFVFQTFNLVPYLTCLENVALPALLAGLRRGEAMERAGGILERLGIAARRRHRPAQLSVGERQRVGIGRAIVNGPKLLLADEPTGNLDPASADNVMDLLRGLSGEGLAVIMVTHDHRLAGRAPRLLRLEAGALQEQQAGAWSVAS